jgi:hypothetical protein
LLSTENGPVCDDLIATSNAMSARWCHDKYGRSKIRKSGQPNEDEGVPVTSLTAIIAALEPNAEQWRSVSDLLRLILRSSIGMTIMSKIQKSCLHMTYHGAHNHPTRFATKPQPLKSAVAPVKAMRAP